jgi:hypothetical protein
MNIEAEGEKEAALEGYSQILRAGMDVETVTLRVTDSAGVTKDITLDVEEADDYAGLRLPTGFLG